MPITLTKEFTQKYEIKYLPKEKYSNFVLQMDYTTDYFYDVVPEVQNKDLWQVSFIRKKLETPITHTSEEYDFPDNLYQEYHQNAYAWGVFDKTKKSDSEVEKPIAVIETDAEVWSNRLRVTEMWVHKDYRRQGLATVLMNVVKEHARLARNRAIILETQSCNVAAIDFYRSCGFSLIGFDSCCYKNNDISRKEVRFEMGYFLQKKDVNIEDLKIVPEEESHKKESEVMCKASFYNRYVPGCYEHLFLHELRKTDLYLPEFSKVAILDGKVVGGIWYTKSHLELKGKTIPLVTFGPLCVHPDYQGLGIGERLLKETLPLVKNADFPGVIICGEPDYYPRLGFKTCDNFGITTADGKNFDAFMGYEFEEGSLSQYSGAKFYEIDVEASLTEEKVSEFDKDFPEYLKFQRPGQWN